MTRYRPGVSPGHSEDVDLTRDENSHRREEEKEKLEEVEMTWKQEEEGAGLTLGTGRDQEGGAEGGRVE